MYRDARRNAGVSKTASSAPERGQAAGLECEGDTVGMHRRIRVVQEERERRVYWLAQVDGPIAVEGAARRVSRGRSESERPVRLGRCAVHTDEGDVTEGGVIPI